jgi:putative transposase
MKRDQDLAFLTGFLHRASTRLVRTADLMVIEDLAVANISGWAEFGRQLGYKCQRYGRELVVIDRWYPSSKTRSGCGTGSRS